MAGVRFIGRLMRGGRLVKDRAFWNRSDAHKWFMEHMDQVMASACRIGDPPVVVELQDVDGAVLARCAFEEMLL